MDETKEIPLNQIVWPDPIRDEISDKDIEDMRTSIMATGQIEPIIVERTNATPELYNGIIGRRRYLGAQRAQLPTILARIHSFSDNPERKVWQIVENVVRRNLNPLNYAEALRRLKQYYEQEIPAAGEEPIVESMQKEIADVSAGEAPSKKTIWKYLDMAKSIPDDIKKPLQSLAGETFGQRHAEQLLRLKHDHDGMVKAASYITECKPTASALKTFIEDYLKVKQGATEEVKQAIEKEEISIRHGAIISQAAGKLQQPILEMTKKGDLKAAQIKKVVDFSQAHEDRVPELLKRAPKQAVAIAEGKDVLETEEQVKIFLRGKNGLAETQELLIPCECPECQTQFNRKITVDWNKGEVKQ
jgi:ParB-like chromosome segregation protein Spo0J